MTMIIKHALRSAAALSIACIVAVPAAAEVNSSKGVNSPRQVQQALGTLNRVADHTGRLIPGRKYSLLLTENNEFKEGAAALSSTLSSQPADLKAAVEPMLNKASEASQTIADEASSGNRAKLAADQATLASSVKQLIAAFPADVRPARPNLAREKAEEKVRAQAK